MQIAILSQTGSDIALISRNLSPHHCQGVPTAADLPALSAQLLIIDLATAGQQLTALLQRAHEQAIPVLLLVADQPNELAILTALRREHASWHLLDAEFKPLQRHAINARVRLLLRLAYPDYQDIPVQQIGDYLFEPATYRVRHGEHSVALTSKEFALALLLFRHLGRPLSRAYLQESIWGPESEDALPTRTIDTHIARLRSKLQLKPEHGFRLATVYGYGYQLEQLVDGQSAVAPQ
ncbi:DNA-binding response OmpR family regulator [Herbaspirillum sp. Sphag1AN]|uniref:winged helix-turn-helix transcriptional regulator n=1 Tax=unclassified Herbaspirillum TaxID=2624150 RepID=UPI00160B250A|nr:MULTISPECIES: response regulator transcription factor [unclassified Herbaspirillum]MBB3212536.1 DNA-binding response OmpR family regulator [Herbaspirillum sp. Sphag1AN]MBB3245733.1 DNA-binding response OmpR family regulator [Herbaspirillum sp. Sphag64]